jgi:hypothetical protein
MASPTIGATTAPATYAEVSNFAAEIYSNLIRKYSQNKNQFTDFKRESTGLMYRCIGSVGMLLLVNAFDKVGEDGLWKDIVLTEFRETKRYIDENGFDSTPLGTAGLTRKYFNPKGDAERYYYLDSVSWVLSFALQMRLAQRQKRVTLEADDGRMVREMIRKTVEILVTSSTEQGGWGFSNKCTQPDLYFSYCVSEALADFGDYVLGEAEELSIDRDTEIIETLPQKLIDSVLEVRLKALDWLKKEYVPRLGNEEIEVYPDSGGSPHLHLYGTFYVIDMLILNDVRRNEESARIERAIEHAIYLSRIDFDRAYEDRAWWDNPDKSSLTINWTNHPTINVNTPDLDEPGFVPLCLRCNALYTYYISRGQDERLKDLFQLVYMDRNTEYNLWDKEGDSLIVTERSIEALVDYADYLKQFDQPEVAPSIEGVRQDASIVVSVDQAIRKIVRDELAAALSSSKSEASSEAALPAKLTDVELLDALTSALAQTTRVLQDSKLDPNRPGAKPKQLDRYAWSFRDQLFELVAALLSSTLRPHVGSTSEKRVGVDVLKEQSNNLMFSLATWLEGDPSSKLSDLFNWVCMKQSREADVNTKSPSSGGKR